MSDIAAITTSPGWDALGFLPQQVCRYCGTDKRLSRNGRWYCPECARWHRRWSPG